MKSKLETLEKEVPGKQMIEDKQSQMTQLLQELTEQQERIEQEHQMVSR